MVLNGGILYFALALLAAWFTLLLAGCWRSWSLSSVGTLATRRRLTIAGTAFSAVAVGSLLFLHLTWVSPEISQRLGIATVRVLSLSLLLGTIAGFLLSVVGAGKIRFLGLGTSLITGLWWLSLYITAGISMGAPIARYPTRYLVPDGYVGWIEVRYGEKNAPELPLVDGAFLCKVPGDGIVNTSSVIQDGWAKDEYSYYSRNGSTIGLKETGWGSGGMIWAPSDEWKDTAQRTRVDAYFFVGTEEQYRRLTSRGERRPFNQSGAIQ
jgi:hypothetical protein